MLLRLVVTSLLIILIIGIDQVELVRYQATWDSLDARPLPSWYDDSKVGIFIHWGVFSVPAFASEWFWHYWQADKRNDTVQFMKKNFKPDFTYPEFGPMFTARHFDPDYWASVFNSSGAKYVVLTSKHHEGFTLWPSNTSWNWNAMDVGPRRDLVGELATAVRKTPLKFGLYHSLFEWFNPLYNQDKDNNYTTAIFPHAKTVPELYDIVNRYKPEVIWSDGDDDGSAEYWTSKEFLAWLYNDSPVKDTVVTNDRWGFGCSCHHGGYFTCQDRYNPGKLQNRKWENAMTIDQNSWGYVSTTKSTEYLTNKEIITTLVQTVSYGGNLLINIGPTSEGILPPIMEERLRQLGNWLDVNGEAIYKTKPWIYQNDSLTSNVYYTEPKESTEPTVYAIFLDWPFNNKLKLGSIEGKVDHTKLELISPDGGYIPLKWWKKANSTTIALKPIVSDLQGWVLKIINPVTQLNQH